HNAPKSGGVPLMGVRLEGEDKPKLMELSYDSGKNWRLLCGDGSPMKHSSDGEPATTQHVVILLRNGSQGTAYVDGQRVGSASCELGNTDSKEISHFYIGGDGGSADSTGSQEGVSVTVTNVLLYNRPLDEAVITARNTNKLSIPKAVAARTSSSAVSRSNRSAEHMAAGAAGKGTAPDGGAHGDGGTNCGSGLLPSLLLQLLGLWGFAAL
ncbi:trans-sialidase, putative, partial [Trypanosoma cruzi marinkellei]